MSGDSGTINLEVPSGVQSQLDLANQQLMNEYNRLISLQQALVSGQSAQYQAIGYNPYTQGPIIGQMVGDILAGGEPNFDTYSKPQGTAPTPVQAPSSGRPIDYQLEFQQMGYKNWGKNDDAKARQRADEQAAWDRQMQSYQNYQTQLNAYNSSGMSQGQFEQYKMQAQYQAGLMKQAMGTPEQLAAEQDLIKQIGQKLQQAPQLYDQLASQLQEAVGQMPQFIGDLQSQLGTAIGNMPEFLSSLNDQLGQAIQGTPDWQKQYKAANEALVGYQNYADKVMAGEVPYDPMIIQTLKDQSDATQGQLMKNLGAGWETSTPAIEAMARNQQLQTAVLESERRKDISAALSNVQNAAGVVSGLENERYANIQNTQAAIQQQYAQRMYNIEGAQQAIANQYNQRFANIFGTQKAAGEQMSQYQQDIVGQLAALQALQSQRYGAMSQLLGTQGAQQTLGTNWASILGGINTQPYSVDYSKLAQLYQQGASVLGQNTLASPGAGTSPWLSMLGTVGGLGLGAAAGYFGGGAGMAASSSLFGADWSKLMSGTGSTGSTSSNTSGLGAYFSDMRLKDLFVARYDEDGRETIAGVPTYDYRYLWDEDTRRTGVIAQDVKKAHPEAYLEVGGYGAVDYGKLVQLDRR